MFLDGFWSIFPSENHSTDCKQEAFPHISLKNHGKPWQSIDCSFNPPLPTQNPPLESQDLRDHESPVRQGASEKHGEKCWDLI